MRRRFPFLVLAACVLLVGLMTAAFEGVQIIELDVDDWGKTKGPTINGGAWGDNVPKNMAPPLTKFFASI